MNDLNKRTDFLFTEKNFWTGLASTFTMFGGTAEFNTSNSGEEADIKAISSDWEMVGEDFKKAMLENIK